MESSKLNPLIVLPGLGGTNLDFSIDSSFKSEKCNNQGLEALEKIQPGLWVNPIGLVLQKDCMLNMLRPRYNEQAGTLENMSGLNVFPRGEYVGDPLSSICLAYILNSDKCYPLTNYSKNFVNFFTDKGYKSGYNLFIQGYDFRLVPYQEHATKFFDNLKELIEKTYKITGKRICLVGHSLGTLLSNMFLNKMSKKWKSHYIKSFVSISPAYDGAPKALRTALSGYDFALSDVINVSDQDFTYVTRSMAGVAATIPLLPGMYGEVKCGNNYSEGTGNAVNILFGKTTKEYNVNNYKNVIKMIEQISDDVYDYTRDERDIRYLNVLTKIMRPISKERSKYCYTDPEVEVYQLIASPVSTETSYLYNGNFSGGPIYTTDVVGDEDIPVYGTNIPEIYKWKKVTSRIFPPIDGINHFTLYTNCPSAYEYIYEIVNC